MVSKSKRVLALLLTGLMATAFLTACDDGGAGTSTPAGTQTSGTATGDAKEIFSDEMTKMLKDKIAEEAASKGKKDEKTGKQTISLRMWCSGDDLAFETALVEQFKELYKDDRYDIKVVLNGANGEDKAATKVLEAPEKAADVFSFSDDQLRNLVQADAIAKVSPLFNSNVIKENSAESVSVCSVDGTAYAFPRTADNGYFMYYDKRVFTDPKDLETFDGMVTKANAAGKQVLMAVTNAWYNSGFFFTAGVTIGYNGKTQTGTFNTPEGLKGAKAIAHLCESADKGFKGSGDDSAVVSGFDNGSLAAAVTGTWNGKAIRSKIGAENLGACKLPTILMDGEQKQLCSFGGYKILGVKASTDYIVTAQTLAYFLTCPESQLKRYNGLYDTAGTFVKGEDGEILARGFVPTATNEAIEAVKTKSAGEVQKRIDEAVSGLAIDESAQAIEAQRPFSQPQSGAGGKYWTPVGAIGDEILNAKGKLTDKELEEKLQKVVDGFAS